MPPVQGPRAPAGDVYGMSSWKKEWKEEIGIKQEDEEDENDGSLLVGDGMKEYEELEDGEDDEDYEMEERDDEMEE